jgi:hypothetical protein
MPDVLEDFWPSELPDPSDPAPVMLLKEQASLLGHKTKGELEGVVRTSTENGTIYYSLCLKADALGDYPYKLLFIAYPAIGSELGIYPITAQRASSVSPKLIYNDEEFRDWLRAELSSEYVRSALGNLMYYVKESRSTRVG